MAMLEGTLMIHPAIISDSNLELGEKFVLAKVHTLSEKTGVCTATYTGLGVMLHMQKSNVHRIGKKLGSKGYVEQAGYTRNKTDRVGLRLTERARLMLKQYEDALSAGDSDVEKRSPEDYDSENGGRSLLEQNRSHLGTKRSHLERNRSPEDNAIVVQKTTPSDKTSTGQQDCRRLDSTTPAAVSGSVGQALPAHSLGEEGMSRVAVNGFHYKHFSPNDDVSTHVEAFDLADDPTKAAIIAEVNLIVNRHFAKVARDRGLPEPEPKVFNRAAYIEWLGNTNTGLLVRFPA